MCAGPRAGSSRSRRPPCTACCGTIPPKPLPKLQPLLRKILVQLVHKIRQEGLLLPEALIRHYHLVLQSASLVILIGPSGMGKSWLGYFNPLEGRYFDTPASLFLCEVAAEFQAARRENWAPRAYHLILDEMNLARVEHYFSPLLSATEVRRRGEAATLDLSDGSQLPLSPNLKLIGTLNLDETTHLLVDCPYAALLLRQVLAHVLSFAFRTLVDIRSYVQAAERYGLTWQTALDEQIQQKILACLRSASPRRSGGAGGRPGPAQSGRLS